MRRWRWLCVMLLCAGCRPTPADPPGSELPQSSSFVAPEATTSTAPIAEKSETETEPETPRPIAPPPLVFTVDGWVRHAELPSTPLLRLSTLRPSDHDDPRPVRALLGMLEPLMACYEADLLDEPELRATVWIRRRPPGADDPEGIELSVDAPEPARLLACVEPVVRSSLPPSADDPYGRYAVSLFPHRDQAPRLRRPELDDVVIEREGGSCWTERTFPCKPNKRCKAPQWERTLCRHPADRPDVALRWDIGPRPDRSFFVRGVELVAADDTIVWKSPQLTDLDMDRLRPLSFDEARDHLDGFRDRSLPGAVWTALEPRLVWLADPAGVRAYDRRTGELRFRYASPPPEVDRMIFDGGTFTARHRARRCEGDAGRGTFAARCGDDLLYFDGYAFAVISVEQGPSLRAQTTLSEPGNQPRGNAVSPTVTLRAAGYRLKISGTVFMH